jgi:hypothetical protein
MKYLLVLLICAISLQVFSEKITKIKAEKIAKNWATMYMDNSRTDIVLEKSLCYKYSTDTSLYIFNFIDNGFIIVPSDDHTYPVLAYSVDNNIDMNNISPQLNDWLNYYSEMIKFNKKEKQDNNIKNKWGQIENGNMTKSVQATVQSLFETNSSSRWAGWRPYFNQAPQAQSQYYEGHNGCVPMALAQIMKYFKYPLIGTGLGEGHNNGVYFTQNINCIFDYSQMPFRLTYCGNGTNNCNEGSFNIIPGVVQSQIDEVGKIQFNAGLAVAMNWIGMGNDSTTSTGTIGTTQDWVTEMANHFYYTSPTSSDYWSEFEITASTSGFKTGLRNSLNNGYPILFRYNQHSDGRGHVVVIDGYENDEFFHFSVGRGGADDAYYYLFSSDNDGIHLPRPYISIGGLNSCMNIHPNCPPAQNKTVTNKTITNGNGELIQSGNDLLIDHFTVQSGGRTVLRATQSIIISNDFEVALGGEIWMICKPCTN